MNSENQYSAAKGAHNTTMPERDGINKSLWQGTVERYESSRQVPGKKLYDVIIAGGGITGISTALRLQTAGKNCLLIEAANIGYGTTGGTTAHLNSLLDIPYSVIKKNFSVEAAKTVAESVQAALELIEQNIISHNIQCEFQEADAFLFAQNKKQAEELDEILQATKEAGVEMGYIDRIPIPTLFTKAAKATGQAKFHPLQYLYSLAKAFEEQGGEILQQVRVEAVEQNKLVEVTTAAGNFTAHHFVYATHIPPGVNWLHLNCLPYRSYAMAVTLKDNRYPSDLSYDMEDPYHYYRTQVIDGQYYLIVGGKDHKTGHEENTERCMRELEAHIRSLFDVESVVYRWSSQYYESADGLPYIGHLPGRPGNIYVATGFGGNGMVYSAVAAITLQQIINGEESPYIKLFDPNRIKPIAGFSNFLQHNAAVAKQYLGKLLPTDKISELSEIAKGEGRVVKYESENIAVYRNEKNVLYAIKPTCTHLQCDVKWNHTEVSWDCPCHGARFSIDGRVLNGPAHIDLEKIDIG